MVPPTAGGPQFKTGTSPGAITQPTAAEVARIQAYLDASYSAPDVRHSFQTKVGEMIDCIDFFAHPSVRALAAKGSPLTTIPSPPPIPERFAPKASAAPKDEAWSNGYPDSLSRPRACPKGSVPMVRQTVTDILARGGLDAFLEARERRRLLPTYECADRVETPGYAHVVETSTTIGNIVEANTTWSIYSPALTQVPGVQSHQIMQWWVMTGCGLNLPAMYGIKPTCDTDSTKCMRVVESGLENGEFGDSNLHFVMSGTNDGYHSTLPDPVPFGYLLANNQAIAGNQVSNNWLPVYTEMNAAVQLYQGGWWIGVGIRYVGSDWLDWQWLAWYPTSWFTDGKMQTSVNSFQVGGEVRESSSQWISRMGSGADAKAGYRQAAYFRDSGVLANGAWNYSFNLGKGNSSPTGSTVPNEYRISTTGGQPGWLNFFYLGGTPRSFSNSNYGSAIWGPSNTYTGTCPGGVPITGLSKPTSGVGAHAIQCGPNAMPSPVTTNCTALTFGNADNRRYTGTGDWDSGYYRAECGYNEYLQGIGQDKTTKKINAIVCCPASVNHSHNGTSPQVFYSGDSVGYTTQKIDWDYGSYKGQCRAGDYAVGVSKVKTTGAPHALLCVPPG
jgi:hypothetical protein